jgi:hypothetical protein
MRRRCSVFINIIAWTMLGISTMPSVAAQGSGSLTSFKPGRDWNDIDGKIIDCHAGNIIYQAERKTYYWFGEHRGSPSGVACYSSKDLYNWKNEGVALNKSTAGLSSGIIERPKVAYNAKTNKFVMWFHYDNGSYGLAHQGVAVCDSAKGPYSFLEHFAPNGNQSRDMGMFSDNDGKTYIGYASSNNQTVRLVELTEDYLKVTKNDSVTGAHCEGPAMLKWNNTYYLLTSLCSGWDPNQATYYTSAKILGAFRTGYGDDKKGNPCINDTSNKTFYSQPSSILKVPGYSNGFIYIGDRWNGTGSTKSQYVFLPLVITEEGKMQLTWHDEWKLDVFTPSSVVAGKFFDLKKIPYPKAFNASGLRAYDLLGRSVPHFFEKTEEGAIKSGKVDVHKHIAPLANGLYRIVISCGGKTINSVYVRSK